ncbi:hypothetical protein BS47DRAFT_1387423 [Hydnum rufescens UP504]|uniref:Uncharacterized protein n=1 Tax=Hydnum rufescens UP504 TaxID=1448309 RepID=A0A9P6BA85_9AGAM|nr:hypothetical protein BS47DRAFT_1387423 [Hydnum rufescens UP504]
MPETVLLWEFKHDVRNCTASIQYNDRMVKLYYVWSPTFPSDRSYSSYWSCAQFETLVYTELHLPSETVYYRTNLRLMRKERAGAIQWSYDKLQVEDAMKFSSPDPDAFKDRTIKSINGDPPDLGKGTWRHCLRVIPNSQDILVAYWTFDAKTLRIPDAGEPIMDDLVTTFLLHFFRRCNRIDFLYPQTEPIPVIPVDTGDGSEETEYEEDEDDDDGYPDVHKEQEEEEEEEEEEDVHDDREP